MKYLARIFLLALFLAMSAVSDVFAEESAGLRGIYYDSTGDPITRIERNSDIGAMRTDERISFRWDATNRPPVGSDFFTAEWKGDLHPPATGTYAFTIISDGAAALWVNDELLIEGAPSDAVVRTPGTYEFTSSRKSFFELGRTYHLRLKSRHSQNNGLVQLWWRTPDGVWEIIPSRYLSAEPLPALLPAGKGSGALATITQYIDSETYRVTRTDQTVSLDLPVDFQNKEKFRFDVAWSGEIEPRISTFYRFHTSADGPVAFSLQGEDGKAEISTQSEGPAEQRTGSVFLVAGKLYPFTLTYRQESGVARARLLWSNAVSPEKELIPRSALYAPLRAQQQPKKQGTGLAGLYYNGEHFEQQAFSRLDPTINFDWGRGSPKTGPVNSDHFSVKWTGEIEAQRTDFYQFSSRVDDRIKLTIDGHAVLDTTGMRAGKINHALPILLEQGRRYSLALEYTEYTQTANINLQWSGSDGKRTIVPREALYATLVPKLQGTGLLGEYFDGENFETLKAQHPAEAINFDWRERAPDPAVHADHFSARWTGWIEAPESGTYTIVARVDDGIRLWIDEEKLMDEWRRVSNYMEEYTAEKRFEAGQRYPIRVEYFEFDSPAGIQLFWQRKGSAREIISKKHLYPTPLPKTDISSAGTGGASGSGSANGTGTGLWGEYFIDDRLSLLGITRIDPTINLLWGDGTPDPAIPRDHFSVRWTGWIEAPEKGTYTFTVRVDDGIHLWIGDKGSQEVDQNSAMLMNEWRRVSTYPTEYRVSKYLDHGKYPIRIETYDVDGPTGIQLLWERGGRAREIVPRAYLYPAPEPIRPRGNGTGLRGRYYRGADTAEKVALPYPVFERTDVKVNFPWGEREVDERLPTDNYSVRWEGFLQPQYEGTYTFHLQADDHAALYIGDTHISPTAAPLISTGSNVTQEYTATKTLLRDRLYYIRVVYAEYSGDARVRLSWSHSRIPKEIIPQTQFYLPNSSVLAPLGL